MQRVEATCQPHGLCCRATVPSPPHWARCVSLTSCVTSASWSGGWLALQKPEGLLNAVSLETFSLEVVVGPSTVFVSSLLVRESGPTSQPSLWTVLCDSGGQHTPNFALQGTHPELHGTFPHVRPDGSILWGWAGGGRRHCCGADILSCSLPGRGRFCVQPGSGPWGCRVGKTDTIPALFLWSGHSVTA